MKRIAALLIAAVLATGAACAHFNPGQVLLSCGLDAAKDPRVIQAVLDALKAPDWQVRLKAVIADLGPVGEEVVVCIVNAFLANPGAFGAAPADPATIAHAKAFLQSRSVVVP
jgi:hypothetical protein